MTPAHPTSIPTDPPPSRAGSLPHWIVDSGTSPNPVEAGLAREDASPSSIEANRPTAIASKLGSHIGSRRSTPPRHAAKPCGSEPARDDASPSSIEANRPTAIASKLAPTLDRGDPHHPGMPPNPVGASLLAMTPVHPTSRPTNPPPSRAGSLPHWIAETHTIQACRQTLWERACSR